MKRFLLKHPGYLWLYNKSLVSALGLYVTHVFPLTNSDLSILPAELADEVRGIADWDSGSDDELEFPCER